MQDFLKFFVELNALLRVELAAVLFQNFVHAGFL